jgi:hypothetical protein
MNLRLPIAKSCLSNVEVLLTIQVLRRCGTRLRSPFYIHSFAGHAGAGGDEVSGTEPFCGGIKSGLRKFS